MIISWKRREGLRRLRSLRRLRLSAPRFGGRSAVSDVPSLGGVLPLEPAAEAIEAGEQDALGDVGLVELVADFPFQCPPQNDTPAQVGVLPEPRIEGGGGAGHQGEKGE